MITQERLDAIRAADEAAGPELRMCPQAWTDRRDLLQYIREREEADAIEAQHVRELSQMMEPISGGSTSIVEIVARMKMAAEIRAAVASAIAPQEHES